MRPASLLFSQAPYCSPNLRTTSLHGSQGPCSARSGAAALQHFMLLCMNKNNICLKLHFLNAITPIPHCNSSIPPSKSFSTVFYSDKFEHFGLNAVYFKVDCILETNFTFPEQSGTDLWDTIEDHKQWLENLKLILEAFSTLKSFEKNKLRFFFAIFCFR